MPDTRALAALVAQAPGLLRVARGFLLGLPEREGLPPADDACRGALAWTRGGAGVADAAHVCLKDAADAHAWIALADAAHDHDAAYAPVGHDHDGRYYTEAEVDAALAAAPARAADKTRLLIEEDFFGQSSLYAWTVAVSGSGSSGWTGGDVGHPGVYYLSPGGTANSYAALSLAPGVAGPHPLAAGADFDATFIFRITAAVTGLHLRVGMMNANTTTNHGCWLDIDTGASPNYRFRTGNGAGVTTTGDVLAPAAGAWVTYRVRKAGGTVYHSVNGGAETAHTTNVPAGALFPNFVFATLDATGKFLEVDYCSLLVTGLGR